MNNRPVGSDLVAACLLGSLLLPAVSADTTEKDTRPCSHCHEDEARSFSRSVMASAAKTPGFLREQALSSHPERCLRCHSPMRTNGVGCQDCHAGGKHPYAPVPVPQVCGKCHDAKGENTLGSYRLYRRRGGTRNCTACHAIEDGRFSHDFKGASRKGFLERVAGSRAILLGKKGARRLLAAIRHRAGHALPGGTTGRSVWLVVTGIDDEGRVSWEKRRRFGWLRTSKGEWLDQTLPPLETVTVEIDIPDDANVRRIQTELIYSFRPGTLVQSDEWTRTLDKNEIHLP